MSGGFSLGLYRDHDVLYCGELHGCDDLSLIHYTASLDELLST